ncbi:MAG: hypothetical protein ACLRIP_11260 [Blautia massiliensis (ex Durand et al. 2017)]
MINHLLQSDEPMEQCLSLMHGFFVLFEIWQTLRVPCWTSGAEVAVSRVAAEAELSPVQTGFQIAGWESLNQAVVPGFHDNSRTIQRSSSNSFASVKKVCFINNRRMMIFKNTLFFLQDTFTSTLHER